DESRHAERVFTAGERRSRAATRRAGDAQRGVSVHARREPDHIGVTARGAVNLIISVNQNVPSCVAVGTNNGCRPVSTYGNNSQFSPLASSAYHGLHVSLVERPGKWGSYRVTYTLSKAMDNVSEFFFSS